MIPSTITQLTGLAILNLVGNQLSRLPVGIASMPKITAIWLAENQVGQYQYQYQYQCVYHYRPNHY